jgi:hypothetical protein
MSNYTRLAKRHGFDHEYEYKNYVKAKCKGKLGEFYLNRCGRSLVKANEHFESVIRGLQEAYKEYIADLRKVFFNCVPVPREYIDREYIIHADLAQKPDVVVPPIEIIPYGIHTHPGKSWVWLRELIAEKRTESGNELSK